MDGIGPVESDYGVLSRATDLNIMPRKTAAPERLAAPPKAPSGGRWLVVGRSQRGLTQ